ncbi:MAG TPA: O-antigen ligase family protein [Candidatus Paceibacterota bacterium]|nr:O-antigen ligase family protein [Candidatus Paceibacterota bacterium]
MAKKISTLNLVFFVHLLLFILVIIGILPRTIVPFWTIALLGYAVVAPLEDSTVFFVRSIPLFIAIPITSGYDALNMWRLLSIFIFVKWLFFKKFNFDFRLSRKNLSLPIAIIFLFACLSLFVAPNIILAAKRIIYFINLSLIGFVISDLAASQIFAERLVKNIVIPVVLVLIAGFIQLMTAFSMDIFQFVDLWTHTIERNLFGSAWAKVALQANTWFAYYGDQLSLRMFSIFPDSHSFPIFILLGLPALFAVSLRRIVPYAKSFRSLFFTRGNLLLVIIPLAYLEALLSGTRGIWAAVIGAIAVAIGIIFILYRQRVEANRQRLFVYLASYIAIFFLLFPVAYAVFISDQFQEHKSDTDLFIKRVHSIIDIAETSNKERIRIWKLSLKSIIEHPVLGRGIGNFPVVLNQNLVLGKAGSSAHNIYLHIAAEMGIIALLASLYFLGLIFVAIYHKFKTTHSELLLIYYATSLIYLAWVLIYSLTDVALFDERTFLLFVAMVALSQAQYGQ